MTKANLKFQIFHADPLFPDAIPPGQHSVDVYIILLVYIGKTNCKC